MKKTPITTRATGDAQVTETSKFSISSRPPTRKPDNYINLTNPAARAAFGRALRQMMGGCHG